MPNYSRLNLSGGSLNCRRRGPAGAEVFGHYSCSVVVYISFFTLKMHEHSELYRVLLSHVKGALCNFFTGLQTNTDALHTRNSSL